MNEWHPISEPPKASGCYLCQQKSFNGKYKIMNVMKYHTNLYELDEDNFYDYKGIGGFFGVIDDGGWYYYLIDDIEAWMELPPEYNG